MLIPDYAYPSFYYSRGLAAVTPTQIASVGGGALSIANIAQSGAPTSTKVEGSIGSGLLSVAPLIPPPVGPVVAVAGLVAQMLAVLGVGSGCGQTCVLSSRYADAAEKLLLQNLQTYFAQTGRNRAAQSAALGNFDAIWQDLYQACSNPALGDAGRRCITDRQAGACVWKQTAEGYAKAPFPGVPQPGECWNWFSGYRDPIANDPDVALLPSLESLTGIQGIGWSALFWPAVILASLWVVS